MTPSRRRRSERRNEEDALPADEEVTDGARESWPLTQRPHPSFVGAPSSSPEPPPSGPSMSGASVSRKLTDLATSAAGSGGSDSDRWRPWPFLLRGANSGGASAAGDRPLPVLFSRDPDRGRAGDSPRTTSSLSAEKNPCFFSMDLPCEAHSPGLNRNLQSVAAMAESPLSVRI
ncbi:hypothetical protein GW17_00042007 [Ensete ventricosum]|nr:hypothetical protein GW17_00042007 [Ensete ventricosum]RZS12970.1 hypothetical protein BHM03_00044483 [Ensete ventricosum]